MTVVIQIKIPSHLFIPSSKLVRMDDFIFFTPISSPSVFFNISLSTIGILIYIVATGQTLEEA